MSMISGIHGQLLEVTVVGCSKLKDTEWISRQDPYVTLEYANTKFRTRTCTDGGKHPLFQEKTVIPLIEGLRELNVSVWNSNTVTFDDFIGTARVQLQKVLSQGYDDSPWALQSKSGKFAGEVKLIMHFANAQKPQKSYSSYAPAAPMYSGPAAPYGYPQVYAPKSVAGPPSYPSPIFEGYPPAAGRVPSYPGVATAYPPPELTAPYPPPPTSAYPPQATHYPPSQQQYPPPMYQSAQAYPPPPQQTQSSYPPGPAYPGIYPPPPY